MTHTRRWTNGLSVFLLLLTFAQLLGKAAPTAREQEGIARGYAYLSLEARLADQTPLLAHLLSALPLALIPDLKMPFDDPAWLTADPLNIGDQILWRLGNDPELILFLARLPNAFLTLMLAAFVYRWAGELYGRWAGLLSLLFCAFDPNLLAHGRLATADITLTVWVLIATYWLWRLLDRPNVLYIFMSGIFLGLALATKFLAWVCFPIGALFLLGRAWRSEPYRLTVRLPLVASLSGKTRASRLAWLLACTVIIIVIVLFTVWGVYGFEIGELGGVRVLAASYFAQLQRAPTPFEPEGVVNSVSSSNSQSAMHFLRGELYVGRRWAYLLVSFLLKTPLPVFAFVVAALFASLARRTWWRDLFVLLFPVILIGLAVSSQVNAGYRYILPALPFVLIYAGSAMTLIGERFQGERAFARHFPLLSLVIALLGWQVFGTLSVAPHYLAYFNEIAGGPENGWQVLIDQDLDRGQALGDLKEWLDRQDAALVEQTQSIRLAYQGVADPAFYGINFEPLPASTDTWETRRSFYPADPAPGIYAISVNSLQGLHLSEPDTYAWFRQRQPIAKVGYSIFIYQVPRTGDLPGVVSLSGLQASEILLSDYQELFGTNDIQFKWFDAARSFIFPAQEGVNIYALIAGNGDPVQLVAPVPGELSTAQVYTGSNGLPYSAVRAHFSAGEVAEAVLASAVSTPVWWSPAITFLPGDPEAHAERLVLPVDFDRRIELLGYSMPSSKLGPGETWELLTWWRVLRNDGTPLKMFVHFIDGQSKLLSGDDRLDVPVDGWEAGDVFYQIQRITVPNDAPPGIYQVELGLYDARTVDRLAVRASGYAIADRVLLTPLRVDTFER
ncbi:MAG: glycosyltransferase family 39 protein [Anaerolineae bacterium]|nr:glycosyltransferase family 39 protein [Anaerolineae bacterium]